MVDQDIRNLRTAERRKNTVTVPSKIKNKQQKNNAFFNFLFTLFTGKNS